MFYLLGGMISGKMIVFFGNLGSLIFTYDFSQLIIEVAYLLYLKNQSKEYWEADSGKNESLQNIFKGFSLKKAKNRFPLEAVTLLIFSES